MTFQEFSMGLGRLTQGHRKDLSTEQIQAFYKLLGHYDARDWEWAVVRLTAADRFPKDHLAMRQAIEQAESERKRVEADQARQTAERIWHGGPPDTGNRMDDLFAKCCYHLIRYSGPERHVAVQFVTKALEDEEFQLWLSRETTGEPHFRRLGDWLDSQIAVTPSGALLEVMPDA